MITTIAKFLGIDSIIGKGIAFLAVLYLVLGAGWWGYSHIYDNGYAAAEAHYTAIIEAEHAAQAEAAINEARRQEIANNAAKAREAAALAELDRQDAENLELRRRLAGEAQQDPDADRSALGADSVLRINKVR